jgi:hypothetical protein
MPDLKPGRLRARVPAAFLAVACLIAAGCATHAQQRARVEDALVRGDYAAAIEELDEHKDPGNVLYLLDRGLLLHYARRYAESNEAFEAAEIRIEDLYTRSLSKEAAALLTSDTVIPYDGAPFERALIHYYRTMNYLYSDDLDEALVECRKANLFLAALADRTEGKSTAYQDDAFLQYLTALLYEDAGDWDDAWVSMRQAEQAYARYSERFGVAAPASLGVDLVQLARGLGYRDEYESCRARYPDAADTSAADAGELILFFENGLAPIKRQIDIAIPILKGETNEYRDRHDEFGVLLAGRYPRYDYEEAKLDYLLRVAVPKLQPRPPAVRTAEVSVGGASARTVVVEDVAALSETALGEAMPKILLKTVLRGLTKYLATRGAKKEGGEVAGILMNIFTAATERADTRGWITLPNDIQMARVSVPPGEYQVTLRFLDAGGRAIASQDAGTVRIEKGKRKYVSWRAYE